jgi:hypothetical protein
MIVNYAARVMLQIVASLHHLFSSLMIVIYDCNMFIEQATAWTVLLHQL